MKNKIEKLVDSILPDIVAIRREIHRRPELAGEEVGTAALIREKLACTDIKLQIPYLQTDVVGMLHGKGEGPNVTLRADIDALPLDELSDLDYVSEYPGKMHACGHDGHTAVLIGAALVLNQLRHEFNGSIRFVFQPGEEVVALGHKLVDAGALDNPVPKAVFALHAWPGVKSGLIMSRPGPAMASAGFFKAVITGRGAHGSAPQNSIDPIVVGSHVVTGLQTIVARNLNPQDAAVVSVCRFSSGQNGNVIPESAILEGTIRSLNPTVGEQLKMLLTQYIEGVCATFGAKCDLELNVPYDVLINTPEYVELVKETALECTGAYEELARPSMGGEDFCFYLQKAPGAFFRLGNGEDSPGTHNPHFNFSDDAIRNGILMMVNLALKTLK